MPTLPMWNIQVLMWRRCHRLNWLILCWNYTYQRRPLHTEFIRNIYFVCLKTYSNDRLILCKLNWHFFIFSFQINAAAESKSLKILLSFAVGGLLGDVFLHLLPEAWSSDVSQSAHGKKFFFHSFLSIPKMH